MSDTVRATGLPPTTALFRRGALLLALLLATSGSSTVRADPPPKPLDPAAKAWQARSADQIVALMAPKGRLTLELTTPATSGSFQRPQAQRTLKRYFEQVASVKLKDVTPRDQRKIPGFQVRIYDYTYQPKGRDATTRQLVITMKAAGGGGWHLDSVRERPRRR